MPTDVASRRPKVGEILGRVMNDAEDEIGRPTAALAVSAFTAGLLMGLSGMGVAILQAALGGTTGWREVVAYAAYPLGFIAVIVGRAQLFTENTLYPIVLVLDRREHYLDTARLWVTVLLANMAGVVVFAAIVSRTGALPAPAQERLVELGRHALDNSWGTIFWSGVVGGWLIALVAWLVEAVDAGIAHVVLIWTLTFVVGIGHFQHAIATAGEILTAVVNGSAPVTHFLVWATAAVVGNAVGGVVIVALLNYAQVMAGSSPNPSD